MKPQIDPETVTVQVPIGDRVLFDDADLPCGLTYAQLSAELGMPKEVMIEHALLAWPHYVQQMESCGGAREDFYERVVEYFYDDIGQEDARLPMETHQQVLSERADVLVSMVERIDSRLSEWMGTDLFSRPEGAPTNVTLHKLTPERCLLNLNYMTPEPELDSLSATLRGSGKSQIAGAMMEFAMERFLDLAADGCDEAQATAMRAAADESLTKEHRKYGTRTTPEAKAAVQEFFDKWHGVSIGTRHFAEDVFAK